MVVDSSALVAIFLLEPEAPLFARLIQRSSRTFLSAASYLELCMVIDRRADANTRAMLDTFLEEFEITVEPVTFAQAKLARQAFDFFGKGRHPAALNFGDCFAYALAKSLREPILFKGTDFSRTDLLAASEQQL